MFRKNFCPTIIVLLAALAFLFSLTGCANVPSNQNKESQIVIPKEVIPKIIREVADNKSENPSNAQVNEVAQKIGNLGFPVLRYNENMINYKPVDDFFKNALAGKEGKVTVYSPLSYILDITSYNFTYAKGKMTCSYIIYNANGIETMVPRNITKFVYTKKGNVYFHFEDGPELENTGFRVLSLSEQSREYYKRYVEPGFIDQGPLVMSWNSSSFNELNWDYILDRLWVYENGTYMGNSKYYINNSIVIPQDIVEKKLQKYFEVPTKTLRALKQYNKKNGTYTFYGFNGGGYSPTLEVSKFQNNTDGTLTLWVDFVELEFGKELAAQSILTVKNEPDGSFKYISNKYTQTK
ncbi:hypothetical protein Sgly_1039 [Syntrophobotulus glycolicus DSM 8271]|uniref:Lipoprotein n=1 Tax=Syntrophobotulus glycolicus (strain DSM 8271 / FlGlyR) TaxID=645991 RepID=F0STT0_SYNGF|nr:DUF6070 family protein [Syntrophobotulus glycolicus]ADY55370.1 hypothetical protein Sgly_1039 [Syntrophobotulus glycolicus DSM 8271]